MNRSIAWGIAAALLVAAPSARAADRTFDTGSLIIPMDLSYQSNGMFQAYGLIYQLLKQGVHVHWVIDPNKMWHTAACNTSTDLCTWDCAIDGDGVKCPYPTASPDFSASVKVVWSGTARVDTPLGGSGKHSYRGGPFVVDAVDHDKALAIVDAWNDPTMWTANPWAKRTIVKIVAVHEATAAFTANSARDMIAAPTIAVFADGNETIATGYLRAAGIPQSNGKEFPTQSCGTCGPNTANPDMLTEEAIMGDMGTCDAPNLDHHNGALFKADGTPAYCQIMSMHWNVTEREKVTCGGGSCAATQAQCTAGTKITFNGHEVVAEVRAFLAFPVHFFAECQAVNAYENTVPNPAWPFLDDAGRDGHFLTTTGTPPACSNASPCSNTDYQCVTNGCGTGMNCCLPKAGTWKNLPGYEVAAQPATVKVLRPDVPYNQFDGEFGTTSGSEPAYNLSTYYGTTYKNNRQVTLLTGQAGPGDQDVWMSGYLDGCGDIILNQKPGLKAAGCEGKISYLGGHSFNTNTPVTSASEGNGVRVFLNALFEAQCTTGFNTGTDSDGDGVDDANDPYPDDPTKCGDSDGDGCDDCASGHFDTVNDCSAAGDAGLNPDNGGKSGGCCDTGSSGTRSMLLALVIGALLVRPRRRRR